MASITTHKSHGDKAGESPKILCEMLRYLGHQERRPLYQGFKEVVNDSEEWRVEVFIDTKKPNKPLIFEAACRRSTFDAGIRDAACQAMYRLRDMYADDLSNTPYHYFPRRRICNTEKEIHCYNKKHQQQHDRVLNQQIRLTEALVVVCDDALEELIFLREELREARCKVRGLEEELRRKAPRHRHKAITASPPPQRRVIVGDKKPDHRVIVGDKKPDQSPGHKAVNAPVQADFFIAHGGGGRRCQKDGCNKGAEGKTIFCKAHGGGKRCEHLGCTKSADGRTGFCIAHGGGRRCSHEGCKKAARGRTDRCVGHGGGNRCHFAGCGKIAAHGSTDFCKSHGGGRRCSWGQPGSDLGFGGAPCDRLATRGRGLCDRHKPLVDDNSVHGGVFFGAFSIVGVALSEGDGSPGTKTSTRSLFMEAPPRHVVASAHEGRVHGGNFMPLMLDGGVGLRKKPVNIGDASTSAPRYWKNMEKPCGSTQRSWL